MYQENDCEVIETLTQLNPHEQVQQQVRSRACRQSRRTVIQQTFVSHNLKKSTVKELMTN